MHLRAQSGYTILLMIRIIKLLTGSVRFNNSLCSKFVLPEYSGIITVFGALGTAGNYMY